MIIKKVFFTLLFFLFFVSASYGQFNVGITSGVNFASYTIDNKAPDVVLMTKTGLAFNLFADYSISKKISARFLLGYMQRGGKNESSFDENFKNTLYFNYIEAAPLITYKFFDSFISTKLLGGLSFGYLTDAKVKSENLNTEIDIEDLANKFNMNADMGLEFGFPINPKMDLILNGKYSLGLTNRMSSGSSKNRDIIVKVGLLYKIK